MKKYLLFSIVLLIASCAVVRDSLYQTTNIFVGTAIDFKSLIKDTAQYRIVTKEFNSVTSENGMKMKSVHPEPGRFRWTEIDSMVRFCKKNNMRLHGHTLVWHESVPHWVNDLSGDKDAFMDMYSNYILTYVSKYEKEVFSWDVVNEAISDTTGEYRPSIWYKTLGPEYIEKAFTLANKANPNALLFYNDYAIENDSMKLKGVLKMIDNLNRKQIPIHGIGIQMHVTIDMNLEQYKKTLQEIVKRGLMVHLSELDVSINPFGSPERYNRFNHQLARLQKDMYYEIVKAYLTIVPRNQQFGITLWGFSDAHTWIRSYFKRSDWPCIYDDKMKRKPAYNGMWKALNE